MHEGHRKRMYEKLKNDASIFDHELLEILLYNALSRKDTNPLAHALIDSFGSLSGVFNAETEQLLAVKGVGEEVALYLKIVGSCMERIKTETAGIAVLKNYADFKQFTIKRMRGRLSEAVEIYCIDAQGRVRNIKSFTSNDMNKVEVDSGDISKHLAAIKPCAVLAAHNHLSGNSQPSANDDDFTKKLQLICNMHNVILYDHCIYASDTSVFSYHLSGKLNEIKSLYTLENITKAIEQNKRDDN